MFRNIWDALKKSPLLDDSFEIMDELHHRTQEMFLLSMRVLMDQKTDPQEIIKMDKEVNKNVQRVRKKVFEYFSLSSVPNIHSGLIMISLVIDYERIGDYAKDLALMRNEFEFEGNLQEEGRDELGRMKDLILLMFDEAHDSFVNMDEEYPTRVTHMEEELKVHYETLKDWTRTKNIKRDEALVEIVSARLLKRIAGHLDNISSSGARPFPKLGFKHGASSWDD